MCTQTHCIDVVGTHTAYMNTDTHACIHVYTHIHTYPILGTKQQAEDLTPRILFPERLLKSSRPTAHVIDKGTHCGPGRGRDGPTVTLQRKRQWGREMGLELMVAKSHPMEHTTKTVPLQQNVCYRPRFRLWCWFLLGPSLS